MEHKPISISDLSLVLPHKTCFEDFSTQIHSGSRIGIIGRNGGGKSALLKIIQHMFEPTSGEVEVPASVIFGYVPQIIEDLDEHSGGERFNRALSLSLSQSPNVLLLDEPTNHLDRKNRKSLMHMLNTYNGTLIVVSHDTELLRNCVDTIWRVDHGKINIFRGSYDDYMHEIKTKRASIEQKISMLHREKKETHNALMQEQARASKRKQHGEKKYADDKLALRAAQERGEVSFGKNKKSIGQEKANLVNQLSELHLPKIIMPKFSLTAGDLGNRMLVSISDGSTGYANTEQTLLDINLSIKSQERVAIQGENGSGKSTLIKAILKQAGDNSITVSIAGSWHVPKLEDIGYLDQHYGTLDSAKSVIETLSDLVPQWSHSALRRHLNDFLFRKNEEILARVKDLSGGEKARLSLAQIASSTPKLLILDEITNNLDLETLQHVVEVLTNYPGAMLVISHDEDFLKAIGIESAYEIKEKTVKKTS